jgi:hypothetical protein
MIIIKPRFLKRCLGRQFLAAVLGLPLVFFIILYYIVFFCYIVLYYCSLCGKTWL